MTENDNHIQPENIASMNSINDSPLTINTSSTPSHNLQFDGKMSLPRRFSYTSINNRFVFFINLY